MYSELFPLSNGKLMDISCGLQQMRAVAVFNLKAVTFLLPWYLVAKACCKRRSVFQPGSSPVEAMTVAKWTLDFWLLLSREGKGQYCAGRVRYMLSLHL